MKWYDNVERKMAKHAIRNLMMYVIGLYAIGTAIFMIDAGFYYEYLSLDIYRVLHGQVWRLITFIIMPPSSSNIFFILISLYVYWMLGTILERAWGSFSLNVYYFGGVIFNVLAAFIVYFFYKLSYGVSDAEMSGWSFILAMGYGTAYINFSLFLGYALTFPNAQMLLFFILPIPAWILAGIELIIYAYNFVTGGVAERIIIVVSLLNVVLFVLMTKNFSRFKPSQVKRRRDFRQNIAQARKASVHTCAVCGKTSDDAPDESFRYCSKCDGNYEYCSEHLYTHTHKTKEEAQVIDLPKR